MARGQKEIFEALNIFEKEKGIPKDYMIEKITKAVVTACKNKYANENVILDLNEDKESFKAYLEKTVVETVQNPGREISLEDAKKQRKRIDIGDTMKIRISTREFGRISIMTARNIIRQAIRDGEKGVLMHEYQKMCKDIVTAVVDNIDLRTGNVSLKIGESWVTLPKSEQIKDETFNIGDYTKVYMVEVRESDRGPKPIISRTHPDLVKCLFKKEVPEISDGLVEIKTISREAGSRTKISVISNDEKIDPVGTCIGPKGVRINAVVDELEGEKIDIIEYSEEVEKFVAAALAPANVVKIEIESEEEKICQATVPDHQISLAIGNKGQNVRLAAKLTGWKIDIVPESGYYTGESQEEPQIIA